MNVAEEYLDLLKCNLTRYGRNELLNLYPESRVKREIFLAIERMILSPRGLVLRRLVPFDSEKRDNGRDWPAEAETMVGIKRLENIQMAVRTVIEDGVPGDVVETGVWRGGCSIFARAALRAYGAPERNIWCADSFEGLPAPNVEQYPQDRGMIWHEQDALAVTLQEVQANFRRYNMLDANVKFLVGWFKDTLPNAPIESVAVLRLDGDLYESTMDALNALYAKVSPGGFIIVDDYGIPEDTCRRAVEDFRKAHSLNEPIVDIDGWGAYWRKV